MLAAERLVPPIVNLWQNQQLCDTNVITADTTVRAHRIVLAAFSDTLLEQFLQEDKEKSSTVDLEEFSSEALNVLLRFCYTGQIVGLIDENIEDTLMCCRRLDVRILLDCCIDYLAKFNASNALTYYEICKRCELVTLSEHIWLFTCDNFETISQSTSFIGCNLEVIVQLLSEDRLNVPSEMCVLEAALAWLEFSPERFSVAQDILSCVRLSLVTPEEIVRVAEPRVRNLQAGNPYNTLFRAMAFHSLRQSQSALTPQFASQPRTGSNGMTDEPENAQKKDKECQTPNAYTDLPPDLDDESPRVDAVSILPPDKADAIPLPADADTIPPPAEGEIKLQTSKEGFFQDLKTKLFSSFSKSKIKDTIYVTGGMDMRLGNNRQGFCVLKCSADEENWELSSKIGCDTHHHAAVFMDGEIFVTGGFLYDSGDPCIYGKPTDLVSVYNVKNGSWTSAAKMLNSRAHHAAVGYNNKIYIVCGMNHFKQVLESVEQYDTYKDQWTEVCQLPSGRLGAAVTLCQDCIYIVGGYNRYLEFPILEEILCLDLKTFSWLKMKPLGMPICHAALTCVQDQLYLVGGRTLLIEKSDDELLWTTRSSDIILKCDPKTEDWQPVDHLQSSRHDASVVVSGSNLIIIGGMCSPTKVSLKSVECFDTAKNVWNNDFPSLPSAISGASAICIGTV